MSPELKAELAKLYPRGFMVLAINEGAKKDSLYTCLQHSVFVDIGTPAESNEFVGEIYSEFVREAMTREKV